MKKKNCHIYYKYLDIQAWANSEEPDEMLQNGMSHQGLYCLLLIQQFLVITMGRWFKF